MELGQRLKQARLEAGLSQRQLCGDTITRNMLSQIENGSARPSMDTLRCLAARLGKPVSYFLEEQTVTSPNQQRMAAARTAEPAQALQLLADYKGPDPLFDAERFLLTALADLALAKQALRENRREYAISLLKKAAQAGAATPYYTPELERQRLLLLFEADPASAEQLAAALPDNSRELLLRATAALARDDYPKAAAILDSADSRDSQWYFLRGEVFFFQKDYTRAADHYRLSGEDSQRVYARLEACYKELEDYKMAYFYACKRR